MLTEHYPLAVLYSKVVCFSNYFLSNILQIPRLCGPELKAHEDRPHAAGGDAIEECLKKNMFEGKLRVNSPCGRVRLHLKPLMRQSQQKVSAFLVC